MTRYLAASLRRANRLLRPYKLRKVTKSIQKAMTGLVVKSALAPLAVVAPKTTKPPKAARSKTGLTLGVVLRQLRVAQTPLPGARAASRRQAAAPKIPDGAQYLIRTQRSATGSRSYKLYLPASQPKRPKAIVLMLHGCSQTPDDFATGTYVNDLAEKHGFAVAYPAQTAGQNASSCWNWFKPANQIRGAGEPAILASLARKLTKEFGLDRGSVFVAGLSAGGAMAAILADTYPDVFSAAGIHSGIARGAAHDVRTAILAMRNGGPPDGVVQRVSGPLHPVRRIVFQGDADRTVHPSNAAMLIASALGGETMPAKVSKGSVRGRGYTRSNFAGGDGTIRLELWMLDGAGHAWSGGRAAGSYTDKAGPDASAQMIRFFLTKPE